MQIVTVHLKDIYPVLGADGRDPVLTGYMPDNQSEPHRRRRKHRAMVVCPGGGYAFVSEREAEPVALSLLPMDFYVFVLTYSVAPHVHPAQIREMAAVFDYLRRRAEDWHIDTRRIAAMGFSAGAHLAAYYSAVYDCPAVREHFPHSCPPAANVLCYPVVTPDERYADKNDFYHLMGYDRDYREAAAFDVSRLVNAHTPPAFIWQTAADPLLPVENSLLYAGALAACRVPFELHIYPEGDHGLSTCDSIACDSVTPAVAHAAQWVPALRRWADLYLGRDAAPQKEEEAT